jgi:hypothetical protein
MGENCFFLYDMSPIPTPASRNPFATSLPRYLVTSLYRYIVTSLHRSGISLDFPKQIPYLYPFFDSPHIINH